MMFAEFDWLQAVDRVGFSPVAYGGLALALWAIVKWTAHNIVTPIRDRAFRFLDRLESNVDSMSENLDQQTTTLKEIHATQIEQKTALKAIVDQGCGLNVRNGFHAKGE
jgi:hypothetical protein